ncbi:MAG: Gfo/Idh/MocA family oxidoreductase, partial [Proteobacteria bacterium]|nr:Gfo/Idh/MocA family oxidoreductase [Pseudomonadota bacterium]
MSNLRIGWIGCGTHAGEMLLPHLVRHNVVLAGLCDKSPDNLAKIARSYGVSAENCTDDAAKLIARKDIDAIGMAIGPAAHVELGCAALERGLPVFMEKPPGGDVAGAKRLQAAAEKSGDAAAREELQRRLDSLLARQHELNARLNQQAERMETFVRDNPMYDLETEFGAALKELAKDIRQSTEATAQQTREVAQASSPPDGSRKVTPEMLQKLQSAASEQAKRLGQVEEQAEEEVSEPLKDLTRLQELMKDFNQFETLFNTQQSLAEQARAYNRKGQLSREDQLALRDLASTQRQVGELLESLEKKLREDSAAAREEFPKAARSGEELADKIGERRLQQLAWNATRSLLAGQGEESFQSTDRLREEMAKLFGECQSEGG